MMTDTQFRDTIKTLLAAFGSNDPAQRQEARAKIRNTLAANRKSWNDLMAILHFGGKHGEKLKKLFAMLGQDNDGEFDNARQKVSDLLAGPQRTWEAFVDSLFSVPSNSWSEWHTDTASVRGRYALRGRHREPRDSQHRAQYRHYHNHAWHRTERRWSRARSATMWARAPARRVRRHR
jgi:hypothetical protein